MTEGLTPEATTLLGDGTVFIAGEGFIHATPSTGLCCTSNLERYDPGTSTFSSSGNTPAVAGQTATLLPDGTVLLSGGWLGYPPVSLSLSEIYHPANLVPAPVLLSLAGDGQGQGAIQHAGTSRIASAIDPAAAGEYLSIYLTGLADRSVIPPQVAIGGQLAEDTFFGSVPGYPGGPNQRPNAKRRCARTRGPSATNLPQPSEQRRHHRCAVRRCAVWQSQVR